MISLTVNGQTRQFAGELTGLELLKQFDRNSATLVIELNGSIITLADFHEVIVRDGDELELVTLVGGG